VKQLIAIPAGNWSASFTP